MRLFVPSAGVAHLLVLSMLTIASPTAHTDVAIIGSGIAGAATAHYLREHLDADLQITVYEKTGKVGGRLQSVEFAEGRHSEAGASVYHVINRNVKGFVERFNLSTTQPYLAGRMGLWGGGGADNHGFELETSTWKIVSLLKMMTRYGFGLKKVNDVMERVIKNFTRLYDIIEDPDGHGGPFRDLAEVLVRVGLYDVTQQTLGQFLRAHDVPERLVDEFVTGCTRVNYGQSPWRMNAFAGTVALKGSGKELYSVQEGNQLLVAKLLDIADVTLKLNTAVVSVQPLGKKWQVRTADGGLHSYDAVIIATPLVSSGIALPDTTYAKWTRPLLDLPMWVTHATFVQGRLRPSYFQRTTTDELPRTILTMEQESIPFSSIGQLPHTLCPLGGPQESGCKTVPLYKVFSRTPLSNETLDLLFEDVAYRANVPWEAYPKLDPMRTFPPVVLAEHLYYANSFEFVVSTMETETIAARNVVNLLREDFGIPKPAGTETSDMPQDEL